MTPRHRPPTACASIAAAAIRSLNHATAHAGYRDPTDIAHVLGELAQLTRGLPLALAQAEVSLAEQHTAGRIALDGATNTDAATGGDLAVATSVQGITEYLALAQRGATLLADALDAAHQLSTHLHARRTP